MFSPGSWEKSSLSLSDNPSQGRNKFTVGINLEDESQTNNRIQLAVHRYNNSTGGSFSRPVNDRSIPSPFRQAFLKNSPKFKNFESDKEDTQNNVSRPHNQYQGVGNFPVVHLKKNTVISKPMKRISSNDFKIQLPELPFNRFLNHSPDICLDTKTSTRSVLDVLQDLSRKRIHTKDDTEANKRKCRGLGGDAPLDIEAPYKPLFVPKTKSNTVTYRDSTTQTQEILSLNSSPTKKPVNVLPSEQDDPKAELRRRLARQNNEIFASLSSSTLSYPIKRSREKINHGKVTDQQDELKAKRAKYFADENTDKSMQNGGMLNNSLCGNSSEQISKTEKKQKTGDKISPSKDRLTAIFIEMQNVNPKVEVLGKSPETNGKDDTKSSKSVDLEKCTNGKSSATESNSRTETSQKEESNSETTNFNGSKWATQIGINSSPIVTKAGDGKTTGLSSLNISKENNLSNSKDSEKVSAVSSAVTSPGFTIPTMSNINFGFKIASTVSSSVTQTPIFSTGILQKPADVSLTLKGSNNTAAVTEVVKNDAATENKDTSTPNPVVQVSASGEGTSSAAGSKTGSPSMFFKFGAGDGIQTQVSSPEQKRSVETSPKTIGPGFFKFGSSDVTTQGQSTPSESKQTSQTTTSRVDTVVKSSPSTTSGISLPSTQPTLFGFPSVSTSPFTISMTTTTTTFSQGQQNPPTFTFSDKTSSANKTPEKPAFSFGFGQGTNNNSMPLFNAGGGGLVINRKRNRLSKISLRIKTTQTKKNPVQSLQPQAH
ncbi:UNVERIFIED_CONTAM: hypothetical protein PYX00_006630 [Menopon gallinae]|uniref:Uncharacterized protein n=1 Tax=Menopon gallinae TaxID=328185 RepID=A0AAW2HW05_9NEOP